MEMKGKKMTLHEALNSIPGDTVLRSHLDGKTATATELLQKVRDERGYSVIVSKRNYGRDQYRVIVADGVGALYSEA